MIFYVKNMYIKVLYNIGKRSQIYLFILILILNIIFNVNECFASGNLRTFNNDLDFLVYDLTLKHQVNKSIGLSNVLYELSPEFLNNLSVTKIKILNNDGNLSLVEKENIYLELNNFFDNRYSNLVLEDPKALREYLKILFRLAYLYQKFNGTDDSGINELKEYINFNVDIHLENYYLIGKHLRNLYLY